MSESAERLSARADILAEGDCGAMRTGKTFDCVQMKWDIQRKLREEAKGLSLDERHALMQRKILADPILGPWLQMVTKRQSTQTADACVAEARAIYGSRTK